MNPEEKSAREYWGERLSPDFSLARAGDRRLGLAYNWWLYRARRRALDRSLKALELDVRGKRVLDLGSGTGFYVDYWSGKGVGAVTGVDITEVSVRNLQQRFPKAQFVCADIASDDLTGLGTFDIISAFDVLFHIADDEGFRRAFANIKRCCREGTHIFVSDYFPSEDKPLGPQESHRSHAHYREVFETTGLDEIYASPVFYLMGGPLPGERNTIVRWLWWFTFRTLRAGRRLRLNTLLGHLVGLPLYLVDGVLTRTTDWGPNMKLMALHAVNP